MSEEVKRPAWMDDELVKDISPDKLAFLEKMFAKGQGHKDQKAMMAALMPFLKKAKQENLAFTPQEMNAAVSAIKKHSTDTEQEQIDKLLQKAKVPHA